MNKVTRDFVSDEKRDFKFKIGHILASGLTGFLAGVIVTGIAFYLIFLISAYPIR